MKRRLRLDVLEAMVIMMVENEASRWQVSKRKVEPVAIEFKVVVRPDGLSSLSC